MFPVEETYSCESGSRMNFFHCSVMSSVSPSEWLLAITSARSGRMTEAEVTISQIMYDGREQLRVKLPDATETEA